MIRAANVRKDHRYTIDLNHCLALTRIWRRQQEDHLCANFDWLAAERIERSTDGEWQRRSNSCAVAGVRGGPIGNTCEDCILHFVAQQCLKNLGAVAGASASRIVPGVGQDDGMSHRLHSALDALVDRACLRAELKLFAGIPILLRQGDRDLLLFGRSSAWDNSTCGPSRLIGP